MAFARHMLKHSCTESETGCQVIACMLCTVLPCLDVSSFQCSKGTLCFMQGAEGPRIGGR